jgi:4-amino-4-deoxy-L-arabinose transferase-like glycosyltransferase
LNAKKVLLFLAISFAIKVLLAAFIPVFGDEAYYYIWSLHPQLSYFDHPGMVSWMISLGHFVTPAGHPLSLRFSFLLLSFFTSLIWIKILRHQNFGTGRILIFLLLALLNPLLGPGSVLATPDVPLVFFWSLSYLCFLKLLSEKSYRWYALLGVFLGLGFCSKYHIVLFVLSGLIYLGLTKKWRELHLPGVLLTSALGALFCSPVFIWNSQNKWASFVFQINHGFGESSFEWAWPAGYLVAQTLVINPFILHSLFKSASSALDRVFSLSQLGFFFVSSFRSVVEGNWPLTSHLHSTSNFADTANRKKTIFAIGYWIVIYTVICAFFFSNYSEKVRKNLINSSQLGEIYPLVSQYQPLYGASYQVASLLSWKTQKNVPKLSELSRVDFYDSLPESVPKESAFYALKYDYSAWPEKYRRFKKTKLQSFDNTGIELYQFVYE